MKRHDKPNPYAYASPAETAQTQPLANQPHSIAGWERVNQIISMAIIFGATVITVVFLFMLISTTERFEDLFQIDDRNTIFLAIGFARPSSTPFLC